MCVCATAKRRRSQAANGYRHLAGKQRPRYKIRDFSVASRREKILAERRRVLQMRGAKV